MISGGFPMYNRKLEGRVSDRRAIINITKIIAVLNAAAFALD